MDELHNKDENGICQHCVQQESRVLPDIVVKGAVVAEMGMLHHVIAASLTALDIAVSLVRKSDKPVPQHMLDDQANLRRIGVRLALALQEAEDGAVADGTLNASDRVTPDEGSDTRITPVDVRRIIGGQSGEALH